MSDDPYTGLHVGRIVTCSSCGKELECWPRPDRLDALPTVEHQPNGCHLMHWPTEEP